MILQVEQKKKNKHRLKIMCEEGNKKKVVMKKEGQKYPTENNEIPITVALRRGFSTGSYRVERCNAEESNYYW